jgi:hypothetical protein
MNAFFKTLFGDIRTVSVVMIVVTTEVLFVTAGQMTSAVFAIPPLVLIGAAWLAAR